MNIFCENDRYIKSFNNILEVETFELSVVPSRSRI